MTVQPKTISSQTTLITHKPKISGIISTYSIENLSFYLGEICKLHFMLK